MKLQLQLHPQDFAMPAELSSPTFPSPTPTGGMGQHSSNDNMTTGINPSPVLPSTPSASPTDPGGDLLTRVVQGAHQTIDRLADTAAPHVQKLQEGLSSASESVSERAGQALDTSEEWADTVRASVRENPLAAVLMAAAVGMLIARATR